MNQNSHSSINPSPVIGVPIPHDYFDREPLWGNAGGYRAVVEIVDAIEKAGGVAQLLFPGHDNPEVDALVFPGGGDIDPGQYGESAHPNVQDLDPELDGFQLALARKAIAEDIPTLGICRGMQVLNVAAGGTLIQHLDNTAEHFPEEARQEPTLRPNPVHGMSLASGSRLHQILKAESVKVNSLHHQAVAKVGQGFSAVAWSEDNIVEAIEGPGTWQLGVQFHPEDLRHADSRFSALFSQLISAAR